MSAYPSLDRAKLIEAIIQKFRDDRFYRRLTVDIVRLLGSESIPAELLAEMEKAGIVATPADDRHGGWDLRKAGEEARGQLQLPSLRSPD